VNKTELWERNVVFRWEGVCGEGWKMSSPKNVCVGGYCNQDWWIYLYHPKYRLFFFWGGGGSGGGLNWVLLYMNENAKWSAELFRILNIMSTFLYCPSLIHLPIHVLKILDLKIVFQIDIIFPKCDVACPWQDKSLYLWQFWLQNETGLHTFKLQ